MKIAILNETHGFEKRIALTPEVAKKFIDAGHEVTIEKNAGLAAGYPDAQYQAIGAQVSTGTAASTKKLLKETNLLLHVAPLLQDAAAHLSPETVTIGFLKPYQSEALLKLLAEKHVTSLAMELIPRISRAQTMDALSSQSNLAGYKATVLAAARLGRAFPMMMTAAGTIPPARVLVLGAGVAGLQAIATAKRLGAIVSAFDVRHAAKEQVESLGATFVEVPSEETGDAQGGYAKEMSDAYKQKQTEKLAETVKIQDVLISTALIPGKKAPVLITKEMVQSMKAGSLIIDLASEAGGNCALSQHGKAITQYDVEINAPGNILGDIAYDASRVYAKNIYNFVMHLMNPQTQDLLLDLDDEILKGACLTHGGQIIHPQFQTI